MQNQTQNSVPAKYEGYLLKKKKWPLKGWHRVSVLSQFDYFTKDVCCCYGYITWSSI